MFVIHNIIQNRTYASYNKHNKCYTMYNKLHVIYILHTYKCTFLNRNEFILYKQCCVTFPLLLNIFPSVNIFLSFILMPVYYPIP